MQSLCNVRTSNVFFHEKDTDRARLHTQSDRQKKIDVWTPYTLLAIGITIRKQI